MGLASLKRQIAELQRQVVGKCTVLNLPGGGTLRIASREGNGSGVTELGLFCQAMKSAHVIHELSDEELSRYELPRELQAIVEADFEQLPHFVKTARMLLTKGEEYHGVREVLQHIRTRSLTYTTGSTLLTDD